MDSKFYTIKGMLFSNYIEMEDGRVYLDRPFEFIYSGYFWICPYKKDLYRIVKVFRTSDIVDFPIVNKDYWRAEYKRLLGDEYEDII